MSYVFALLVLFPAFASIGFAAYSMFRFAVSTRGTPNKDELLVGTLGVFSVFFPWLMSSESRKHFGRFLLAAVFGAAYGVLLLVLLGKW